ncbi:hypothetical protein BH11PAT2_BH11PAT2_08010 [soil metagenome]
MNQDTTQEVTLESIAREVRSARYTFGISIIVIAIILVATLPEVIQNSIFRNDRSVNDGIDQPIHRAATTTSDAAVASTSTKTP